MTNTNKVTARIATLSTAQIEEAHRLMENPGACTTPEHRLVKAALADELTRRWDIDAELDEVYMDIDYSGTYHAAMLKARELKAARA